MLDASSVKQGQQRNLFQSVVSMMKSLGEPERHLSLFHTECGNWCCFLTVVVGHITSQPMTDVEANKDALLTGAGTPSMTCPLCRRPSDGTSTKNQKDTSHNVKFFVKNPPESPNTGFSVSAWKTCTTQNQTILRPLPHMMLRSRSC